MGQAPTMRAPDGQAAPPHPAQLAGGTTIGGRFEVLHMLGEGGSGTVYAARDRLMGEKVALKVLHPSRSPGDEGLVRLRAEVRAARRISHPNVCRVHDLYEDGDLVFVVMELLRGNTLRRRMRDRLSVSTALELARQLGAGLAAAHRAGVVHCDVKPENAIECDGRVVLTDFGIARLVGQRGSSGAPIIGDTAVVEGTPAYMAPEQLRGESLDERTDVYGLAAVIWELLAGAPPFVATAEATVPTLVDRILRERPGLPSAVRDSLGERASLVEGALLHGLAKEQANRWESVDALVAAVIAAAGRGGGAAPASWADEQRTRKLGLPPTVATPPRTQAPPAGPAKSRGVRRIASVLHIAVEERDRAPDEEAAAECADALADAAHAALADAGGSIVVRTPRSIIAVFGATASHGDEPHRAADAARAVLAAASGMSDAIVRAGLDTGRLLVRDDDAPGLPLSVSGDALARAARLAVAAGPGEARVSARTARHLSRRFQLDPAGEDHVLGARRPGADVDRAAPLVGRERALETITGELARAQHEGWSRAVLVLGPPGIGKSRLRRELVDAWSARADLRVVVTSADPDDALASHAVMRRLVRAAGVQTTGLSPALAAAIDSLVGDAVMPPGAPAIGAARAALAAAAPLVVVVDDAHWADDATLELLEGLARGEVAAPIAVLVLARPELLRRRPHARRAFAFSLELAPLRPDEARALAAHHLGPAALDDDVRALAEASDGNPFFVEELAADRLERAAAAGTPSTVEAAIQARLDRLAPATRELLRTAAVLGRSFARRDLATLLAGVVPAELDRSLVELEQRRIVFPLPSDGSTDDRYVLKHSLVRDVAYGELLPAARRTLHGAAASVLRDADAARGAAFLVELARHLEGAGDPEAAATWRRAGDVAIDQGAPEEAMRCYTRARALGGADVDLLVRLGEAAITAGAVADAAQALDEALAVADASPLDRARALLARSEVSRQRARWDEALGFVREGLALVNDRDHPVLAARLRASVGWILGYVFGDNDHGLPESARAVELLEGTPHLIELARVNSLLGGNYMRAGRWRDQLRCNRRGLALGEALQSIEIRARAHMHLGVNLTCLGELVEAETHARRAVSLFEQMHATASVALARSNLGCALIEVGRLDEAEREIDEAVRLSDRCGATYFRADAEMSRARIAAMRGRLDHALAHAETALRMVVESGSAIEEGIARRVLGAVMSMRGDHAAADRELGAARAKLATLDPGERARVVAEEYRAARRAGRDGTALRAEAEADLRMLEAAQDLARLDDLAVL